MCGGNVYGDGWRILTKVLAGWERGYSRAVQRGGCPTLQCGNRAEKHLFRQIIDGKKFDIALTIVPESGVYTFGTPRGRCHRKVADGKALQMRPQNA